MLGCEALVVIREPQGLLNDTVFDFAERVLAYMHLDSNDLTVSMCDGGGRLFDVIPQFTRQELAVSVRPVQKIVARSMMFCSSRMLPGSDSAPIIPALRRRSRSTSLPNSFP